MNTNTVYINFFDNIDPVKANKFMEFCTGVINQHNPTELYFCFFSPGGDVDSGFALYNYLVSLQSKLTITMHNTSTIDSIANVIFMAGKNRFAAPNSSFLFHGVTWTFSQSGQTSTQIKETLSRLNGMEKRIAETIAKHTILTESDIETFFRQGEGKTVEYALEKEVITEIKSPAIHKGALILTMNFK